MLICYLFNFTFTSLWEALIVFCISPTLWIVFVIYWFRATSARELQVAGTNPHLVHHCWLDTNIGSFLFITYQSKGPMCPWKPAIWWPHIVGGINPQIIDSWEQHPRMVKTLQKCWCKCWSRSFLQVNQLFFAADDPFYQMRVISWVVS